MPGGIKRGQVLTKENLNVFFYVGGNLTDPFSVTYTLYDSTTGTDQVIGLPDRTPIKFAVGSYYAPWEVPDDEPTGIHKIEWKYKDSATSAVKIDVEEFNVLAECAALQRQYSDFVMWLIKQLRIKLRDVNPDRDYSIDGKELITLDVNGEEVTLSIEEFYKTIYE